jgi:CDP-diglyceride synthetase
MGMDKKIIIATIATIILSILFVVFLWQYNWILFVVLAILSIANLLLTKSLQELKTFIFGSLLGPIFETFAILSGTRAYSNPNVFVIPCWLFLLWGLATLVLVRGYEFFKAKE